MMKSVIPELSNSEARRLFLARHGLLAQPKGTGKGDDLSNLADQLGFVQVDSINTVARAHHMILFARRPAYKEKHLKQLLEKDRSLFEHWTHDASVIPTAFFPHWRLRFKRDAERLRARWRNWHDNGFEEKFDAVLKRISDHGPVTSGEVGEDEQRQSGGWWDWHPSKTALEYLWRSGALAVCRRNGFQKVYDLTERIIPAPHLAHVPDHGETIEWAAASALDRLGFATSGEIAAFWDLITPAEARAWCQDAVRRGQIVEAAIAGAAGQPMRKAFVRPDVLEEVKTLPEAPARIRVLSPFDPALRDRKRAERLFGFHYRIEVFVPEAKRQYGYYVFPVLEGEHLIGRIDMKAYRAEDRLHVRAFWPEPSIRLSKGRVRKLLAELDRVARFAGCRQVTFEQDWQREPARPHRRA
ncbi:winged helix-turn-helix domain-containing protein [Roseibium sp. RKSG952]|uniref:winged helix-turn-helix domain-containing protein n=1 Tax=Roseibium sp. RKSG952 TaxID=2529384 RepID=UPI0012BCC13E|nr:crosslink repair DNA glycosylase YcaQ family protein [Roseibium sp. RKSG952]MTH98887.1 winged helix-turn-helix domain-containing protein [Roseibium sp. RKSG952]